MDPLSPDYPWYTPYQFAGNMPIMAKDLDGLEPIVATRADEFGTHARVAENWLTIPGPKMDSKIAIARKKKRLYRGMQTGTGRGLSVSSHYQTSTYADPLIDLAFYGIGGSMIVPVVPIFVPVVAPAIEAITFTHFVMGAGIETTAQLTFSERGFEERLLNLDLVDITISGFQGGYLKGASGLHKFGIVATGELGKSFSDGTVGSGINFNSASSTLKDAAIGIATSYGGDFVSEGLSAVSNKNAIAALEEVSKKLKVYSESFTQKGLNQYNNMVDLTTRLKNQIMGNNITSEVIGTGVSEIADDQLKGN